MVEIHCDCLGQAGGQDPEDRKATGEREGRANAYLGNRMTRSIEGTLGSTAEPRETLAK